MDKFYQRNLVKEKLQDYVLNFVYNDKDFKNLIFTGGTDLRKLYNLPRLSEDLDFDFKGNFNIFYFEEKIKKYFLSDKKINLKETKIAGNKKTIFLKFLASEFLSQKSVFSKEIIFVRCDFSKLKNKFSETEVIPFSSGEFNFFVLSYDLSTLFANKIAAFLERKFFKGDKQKISFKGRDLFDIVWFINLSAQSGFKLKPNWKVLQSFFPKQTKEKLVNKLLEKSILIEEKEVRLDLTPFIGDRDYLDNFLKSYKETIKNKAIFLI